MTVSGVQKLSLCHQHSSVLKVLKGAVVVKRCPLLATRQQCSSRDGDNTYPLVMCWLWSWRGTISSFCFLLGEGGITATYFFKTNKTTDMSVCVCVCVCVCDIYKTPYRTTP